MKRLDDSSPCGLTLNLGDLMTLSLDSITARLRRIGGEPEPTPHPYDPSHREFFAICAPDDGGGYVTACPCCAATAHIDTDANAGGCFDCGATWYGTGQPEGEVWPMYLDAGGQANAD
jgi:hypothetical protein